MKKKIVSAALLAAVIQGQITWLELEAAEESDYCPQITASEGTNAACKQFNLNLLNGDFESTVPGLQPNNFITVNEDKVEGWKTTATDHMIEVWNKGFYGVQVPAGDASGVEGNQFVELNANQDSSLYQDFTTEPGQTIKVRFKHGGRKTTEHAALMIGAPAAYSGADKYPTTGREDDVVVNSTVGMGEWKEYAVSYTVPAGQTTTRIAFTSKDNGSVGNFIEGVHVEVDSLYNTEIDIKPAGGSRGSYRDMYRVTSSLGYVNGPHLGGYQFDINTGNFSNLKDVTVYDAEHNPIPSEDVDVEINEETGHILVTGGAIDGGYVEFYGKSAIDAPGELSVTSTLTYMSKYDVVAGHSLEEAGYWVKDKDTFDTFDDAPIIISDPAIVDEGTILTDQQLTDEFNIHAYDLEDEEQRPFTMDSSNIDYTTPGKYYTDVTSADSEGRVATTKVELTVNDVLPVITTDVDQIKYAVGTNVTVDQFLADINPIATEITTGDINETIEVVDFDTVDFNTAGDYKVTITASDDEGNIATKEIIVVVEVNEMPIVITATDEQAIDELKVGESLTDEQLINLYTVTAIDPEDGDLTDEITVDQTAVNYSIPGDYPISFTATDRYGAVAEKTVTLKVTDSLPVITLSKPDPVTYQLGTDLTEVDYKQVFGVTATELADNDLYDRVEVSIYNQHNLALTGDTSGEYEIRFNVEDDEGNKAEEVVAVVNVVRSMSEGDDPIDVTVEPNHQPQLTADLTANTIEETTLTDQQLIELFNVQATDADDNITPAGITVDQTAVNYSSPGDYDVVFNVVDQLGMTDSITSTLTIEDKLPTLQLTTNQVEYVVGTDLATINYIAEFEPVATEFTPGDLNSTITVDSSAVVSDVTGLYTVNFTATDSDGNTVTTPGTVKIVRDMTIGSEVIDNVVEANDGPQLTADSSANTSEETALTSEQLIDLFNVQATDADDNITVAGITVDQTAIDYTTPGEYDVVFNVEDELGLTDSITTKLTVTDVLPTITSAETVTVNLGTATVDYKDIAGVVATEITTNDLFDKVEIDSSAVSLDVTGTYPVNFSVSDQEGNLVTTTTNVIVQRDIDKDNIIGSEIESEVIYPTIEPNTAPTIAATDASTHEEQVLTDAGLISLFNVTANDAEDDLADLAIKVDQDAVNYKAPGTYPVTFTVTDSFGMTAQTTNTLTVTDVVPTIGLTNNDLKIELDTDLTTVDWLGYFAPVASEINTGDLTAAIAYDYSRVVTDVTGTYPVTFSVSDEEGNNVTTTGNVIVGRHDEDSEIGSDITDPGLDPNTAPTITANSDYSSPEEQELNDASLINYFGVTATDSEDGDLDHISVDKSKVNFHTPGTYPVTFTVADSFGMTASVTSNLTITDVLPTIHSYKGLISVELGTIDVDYKQLANVIATEITSNDLYDKVIVDDSNVITDMTGTYPVTFTAIDEEGNSVSTSSTVTVVRNLTEDNEIESETDGGFEVNTKPQMDIKPLVNADEEHSLTDEQLISLFQVKVTDEDGSITPTVDQSKVNYHTPGKYPIVFTATDSEGLVTTEEVELTITDVLPTISVGQTEVTGQVGMEKPDYISLFKVTATEIIEGDLNGTILMDDSNVDLSLPGTYPIIFTVTDEENNSASTTTTVVIPENTTSEDNEEVSTETEDITPVTIDDTTSEATTETVKPKEVKDPVEVDGKIIDENIDVDDASGAYQPDATTSETNKDNKFNTMELAKTGNNLTVQITSLTIVLLTVVGAKKKYNK